MVINSDTGCNINFIWMLRKILGANFIKKLQELHYLNRGIIFFTDLLFSVTGTLVAYSLLISLDRELIFGTNEVRILIISAVVSSILFVFTRLYRVIVRHSSLMEVPKILLVILAKVIIVAGIVYLRDLSVVKLLAVCAFIDLLITSFLMISARAIIVNIYYTYIYDRSGSCVSNAYIYGTTGISPKIAEHINKALDIDYKVVGFITRYFGDGNMIISGIKSYFIDDDQENDKLLAMCRRDKIKYIIFSSKTDFIAEKPKLVEFCVKNNIQMMLVGEMLQLDNNSNNNIKREVKPIQVEDLLDREVINIDIDKISAEIDGKIILVTGAAGSIGREIVMQLATLNTNRLILLDNAETPLHSLKLELDTLFPNKDISYNLGDVRSKDRILSIFESCKIDVVFHAAAYKHVPMIEINPCEAVLANVWGTINVAQYASEYQVEKFIMISTDKAVNPTSVMGASKRIAEKFVQTLNGLNNTQFIITRFGNVLGSNGSVIPYFKEQIAKGGPVTVTHPDIIRYFMTIPEACRLVLQAYMMGKGGEIYVFDMGQQVKIADLARRMISLSGFVPDVDIKIAYTGLRPGEKLYEELLTDNESTLATQHKKIRVAQVDNLNDDELLHDIKRLVIYARKVNVDETIMTMKKIAPEYISNHSVFEKFDKNK